MIPHRNWPRGCSGLFLLVGSFWRVCAPVFVRFGLLLALVVRPALAVIGFFTLAVA